MSLSNCIGLGINKSPTTGSVVGLSSYTCISDNFNDDSIDTATVWNLLNPDAFINEQNGRIEVITDQSADVGQFVNELNTQQIYNSGVAIFQTDMSWSTEGVTDVVHDLYIRFNANYYARILNRNTVDSTMYRLQIRENGVNVYDFNTSVTKGKSVRIKYDFSNNNIIFEYWNGNTWIQMGTTQIVDLTVVSPACKGVISVIDQLIFNGAFEGYYDNMYWCNEL